MVARVRRGRPLRVSHSLRPAQSVPAYGIDVRQSFSHEIARRQQTFQFEHDFISCEHRRPFVGKPSFVNNEASEHHNHHHHQQQQQPSPRNEHRSKHRSRANRKAHNLPLVAAISLPLAGRLGEMSCNRDCENRWRARRSGNVLQKSLSAYAPSITHSGPVCSIASRRHRRASEANNTNYNFARQATCPNISEPIEEEEEEATILEEDSNIDAGYAWVVLAVIFVISTSTFGTARAYGLIFERLVRDNLHSRTMAAMPFTVMGAFENMAGPLSGYLLHRSQNSWRWVVFAGSALISIGHFLAALTVSSLLGQIVALGLMCGMGLSFVVISFFQINNAYFVRYRSTAFGIGLTGAAFGTFYISPLCQHFLDTSGIESCYLMLGLVLLPNVPLSLLLKPKLYERANFQAKKNISTISEHLHQRSEGAGSSTSSTSSYCSSDETSFLKESLKRVLANPMFHLLWPTQLLFCWFNFVFGMIIVDLGRDRGLAATELGRLPSIWAAGQLVGRLLLGPVVDMRFLSYRIWTVLCFLTISLVMLAMNTEEIYASELWLGDLLTALVFVLSIFIALLYILFNGLLVTYVERQIQPLCIGISSFVGSFLLLPRANVIGYYRDSVGNYDSMISLFTWVSLCASVAWLLGPPLGRWLHKCCKKPPIKHDDHLAESPDNKCARKFVQLSTEGFKNSLLSTLDVDAGQEAIAEDKDRL